MIAGIRSWPISRQIALLIAAALLLLSAGNAIVTFAGPPPFAAPFRLSDMPALLRGGGRLPPDRQLATNGYERDFVARTGEVQQYEAAVRLAQLLDVPVEFVRVSTSERMRPGPGFDRVPNQLEGSFSIGLREAPGRWHILRSAPKPLFTAWHRTTLLLTIALAIVLGLIAAGVTGGIVRPIRRLSREADEAYVDGRRGVITVEGPREVAHLARTIATMRDRFAALVENRTMMLAAIAHDMAAPLTRLEFHVAKLPAKTRIEAEADLAELSAMIASILGFAKGQQGLDMAPLDLAALARDIIGRRDKDEAPLTGGAMPLEAWVLGDRVGLRRLIDNLVSNAQRYAGGGMVEIEVDGDVTRFMMIDDGPGFDPALSEKLFDPFFRVEGSRSRETAGTGLGLATARAMAEAHGGTLEAHSGLEGGASFVLTLPALKA